MSRTFPNFKISDLGIFTKFTNKDYNLENSIGVQYDIKLFVPNYCTQVISFLNILINFPKYT